MKRPIERPWASIIIVNYNAKAYLQAALDALAAQSFRGFEVLLVDNASTDGSMDRLRIDHLPHLRTIKLDENVGFAKANNIAARAAVGEWLAFLNPDTEADINWLDAFRRATVAHPKTIAFAGATTSLHKPNQLDGAGDCYHVLGIPWRGGFGRPRAELPNAGECFSPCGASALMRKDIFLEMDGFDERFFCYCEDVDLGFRLRLSGYACIFWPSALAAHAGSGTTGQASPFSVRHGTRNRLWVFVKNMPPLAFWALLPGHILISFALLGRAISVGRGRSTAAGLWQGFRGLPTIWRARQEVQARRRVSSTDILKAMSWRWHLLRHRKPDIRPIAQKRPGVDL